MTFKLEMRECSASCVCAGLTGQVVDVPFAITANMLIMQIAATSLQNQCAEAGDTMLVAKAPACQLQRPVVCSTACCRMSLSCAFHVNLFLCLKLCELVMTCTRTALAFTQAETMTLFACA